MKTIKKEDLISLWTREIKEAESESFFLEEGSDESPYYLFNLRDGISLFISALKTGKGDSGYNYNIGVIFEEFVNYKNFSLDKSEFDSLVNMFLIKREKISSKKINNIVKEKEELLISLIRLS